MISLCNFPAAVLMLYLLVLGTHTSSNRCHPCRMAEGEQFVLEGVSGACIVQSLAQDRASKSGCLGSCPVEY